MPKIALTTLILLAANALAAAQNPAAVPPADFTKIVPADFTDEELRYVMPLYHFHRVANAVVEYGDKRGFIDLPVWRDPKDNQPYNARVLENHVALAFFYTIDRPWNPYFKSPAVRAKLEAVLDRWSKSQNEKGLFAEYAPDNFSLAPTGFGARTMARTLELLADGLPIDAAIHQRVVDAQRKAILALIADDKMLTNGRNWSNQYSGIYAATLSYVRLFPTHRAQLMRLLEQRIREAGELHQSPAGYMYEQAGPDFGYTLAVHQNNITIAWPDARNTPIGALLNKEAEALYKWASYNVIRQPDGSGFYTNYGVSSRTGQNFTTPRVNPQSEFVELARPLTKTTAEVDADLKAQRAKLEAGWGKWPELRVPNGNAYEPTPFTDIDRVGWRPTEAQRVAALQQYPYLAKDRFVDLATDSQSPVTYSFIRRPAYYATFTGGKIVTPRQRYGLGLVWSPKFGIAVQSQSGSDEAAWGTRAEGAKNVYEAATFEPSLQREGKPVKPSVGWLSLPDGAFAAKYKIGKDGEKTITFDEDGVTVKINHPDAFVEQIPLLLKPGETPITSAGRLAMVRGGETFVLTAAGDVMPELKATETLIGGLQLAVVQLRGSGSLEYRLSFSGEGK